MSLKLSGRIKLPEEVERPRHVALIETLGIFGIHADYMARFLDFLEEEGLRINDDRIELLLPVIKNLGTQKLKTIHLKKEINGVKTEFGDAFRKLAPIPTLQKPDTNADEGMQYLQENQVVLNWYPRIQAMKSAGVAGADGEAAVNKAHFSPQHVTLFDVDYIYFELERFKAERGWYNLNLTRNGIVELLSDQSWYHLLIPAEEVTFASLARVLVWQEIALALLKKYTERYYTFRKRELELPHLEYREISVEDTNLVGAGTSHDDAYYCILIDRSEEEIVIKLEELKNAIAKGELEPWEFRGRKAIWFGRHLYEPLLYLNYNVMEIPVLYPAPRVKSLTQVWI